MAKKEQKTKSINAILKLVLLGDGAVGKTTLRKRFLGEGFKAGYSATIGAAFAIKRINLENYRLTFQIWDLAGQQRFQAVRELYYRGSRGALLIFDVTNPDSFNNLPSWLEELWKKAGRVPMILCGNKIDLRDGSSGSIQPELGQEYAHRLSKALNFKVPYIETSALTGEKVNEAFFMLGLSIIRSAKKPDSILEKG
jgi:small GTP-binding protein